MPEEQKQKLREIHRQRNSSPTKLCPRCQQTFPRSHFGQRVYKGRPPGVKSYCPPCDKAYAAERQGAYAQRTPQRTERRREQNRKAQFRRKYGITPEDYERMKIAQGQACAICRTPPNGHNLYVDHDHCSGKVRALLCRNCNAGLGYFLDAPERMEEAAAYVRRFTAAAAD